MHYDNPIVVKLNSLTLGVYLHGVLGSEKTELVINSIIDAKYFNPFILYKILQNPNKYFKRFKLNNILKTETWYILIFQTDENGDLKLKDTFELPLEIPDDILKLH
jgi:hypothetical protein